MNSDEAYKVYVEKRAGVDRARKKVEAARAAYKKAEHEFWVADGQAAKACNRYIRLAAKEAE